jgi:hypothetical protein
MKRALAHDRFDALAGAVMLGEATEAERASFAAHAGDCALCCDVADGAAGVLDAVERARAAETWRPSLDDAVGRRIRDSRKSRFRGTIGVLGWAVALSIVFNVALISGLSTRIHDAFADPGDTGAGVASMKIELEAKAPPVSVPASSSTQRTSVALVTHHLRHARKAVVPAATAPEPVTDAAAAAAAAATDVPDVLAGLGLDGTEAEKHVAVQPRCEAASADPAVAVDTEARACDAQRSAQVVVEDSGRRGLHP